MPTTTPRTLVALRALIRPGVALHIRNHRHPDASRHCHVVRARRRAFSTTVPGRTQTWITYPPAIHLRWESSRSVTFLHPDLPGPGLRPWLTITIGGGHE